MLHMIKGCTVPFPEQLFEGYEINGNRIIANVDADKIENIFRRYIAMHGEEEGFFFLELPARQDEEEKLNEDVFKKHKHVYYIDALSAFQALQILSRSGELLIHDGLSYFGFGYPEKRDEIMLGKYNVITIDAPEIGSYADCFEKEGIRRVDQLKTAWDTFSQDHPGMAERITVNGKTAYDLLEEYKAWGIYKAETRED